MPRDGTLPTLLGRAGKLAPGALGALPVLGALAVAVAATEAPLLGAAGLPVGTPVPLVAALAFCRPFLATARQR